MSVEDKIKEALDRHGVEFNQIVEVDPVENDWLITGVKAKNKEKGLQEGTQGHTVPAGKSIIQRLEDLADLKYKMKVESEGNSVPSFIDHYVQGICEALAIMKNSSLVVQYKETVERYEQ